MCTGNTVLMLVPLSVIIRFGSHVLATELVSGVRAEFVAGRAHVRHPCAREVESDGQVVRLPTSLHSGLLGRTRREAHHLPRLDPDHQDQV